jgi:uncharacterized protein YjbI with pentapeptide repeats
MADLYDVNFRNTDLFNTNFRHTSLKSINFSAADLLGASFHYSEITGCDFTDAENISNSDEVLAYLAASYDSSLLSVASMIKGGMIGCWNEAVDIVKAHFSKEVVTKLVEAWTQCESWGVREKLIKYGVMKNEADSITD